MLAIADNAKLQLEITTYGVELKRQHIVKDDSNVMKKKCIHNIISPKDT